MKSNSIDSSRYAILQSYERFTPQQKSRLINPWDILEAAMNFGEPIAERLKHDYWLQYKFWDSASMILQCEQLCPTDWHVRLFKEWAFGKLNFEE